MNTKHFFATVLTIIILSACCYKVDCEQNTLKFGLVSFSPSDIDTIIFRRFEANSNFQSLKDTMQINNINVLFPVVNKDTVLLQTSNSTDFKFQLGAGYDYEVFIPGISKTTRINNILEEQTQKRMCDISDGSKTCHNLITGYRINGEAKRGESFLIYK